MWKHDGSDWLKHIRKTRLLLKKYIESKILQTTEEEKVWQQ